jgi:hypothetical protein
MHSAYTMAMHVVSYNTQASWIRAQLPTPDSMYIRSSHTPHWVVMPLFTPVLVLSLLFSGGHQHV